MNKTKQVTFKIKDKILVTVYGIFRKGGRERIMPVFNTDHFSK